MPLGTPPISRLRKEYTKSEIESQDKIETNLRCLPTPKAVYISDIFVLKQI